jgi:hypothetical protein
MPVANDLLHDVRNRILANALLAFEHKCNARLFTGVLDNICEPGKHENASGILHHVAAGLSGCRWADWPVLLGSSF